MKRINNFKIIIALVCCFLVTSAAVAKDSNGFHFVGYTTQGYTGDLDGSVGAAEKCRLEFGKGTRMCTTQEFFKVLPPAGMGNVYAWIQPVVVAIDTIEDTRHFYDYSGHEVRILNEETPISYVTTCDQWSSPRSSHSGYLVYIPSGYLNIEHCDVPRPIACCAP